MYERLCRVLIGYYSRLNLLSGSCLSWQGCLVDYVIGDTMRCRLLGLADRVSELRYHLHTHEHYIKWGRKRREMVLIGVRDLQVF